MIIEYITQLTHQISTNILQVFGNSFEIGIQSAAMYWLLKILYKISTWSNLRNLRAMFVEEHIEM